MNILLVDDEAITIELLMSTITWDSFSFDYIYTASSAAKAKQLLSENKIEILLCDIEMPMASGFALLEWIRQENLAVECIFLTCHADFSYAQEALKLGSIEYILKPIQACEVEAAIRKAVKKHTETSTLAAQSRSWQKNRSYLYRQFWTDLISGSIEPVEETLSADLEGRNLTLDLTLLYFPVLITTVFRDASPDHGLRRKRVHVFHTMAKSVFAQAVSPCYPISQSDGTLLIIQEIPPSKASLAVSEAEALCERFLAQEKETEDAKNYCYLGSPCAITRLPEEVESLQTLSYQNVVLDHQILRSHCYERLTVPTFNTNLDRWQALLEEQNFLGLHSEIIRYLSQPHIKRQMGPAFLQQFYLEYYQMLVAFTCRRQLLLTEILPPERCISLSAEAVRSLKGMLSWIKYSTQAMEDYFLSPAASTPVQKVKEYIADHLCENLTVTAIADQVHMNSSYLTRIFKRDTGYSIHHYIQEQKIHLAKQRLAASPQSIGEIALDLGYQSYVSFSRAFSKIVGMSPKEYKQQLMGGAPYEK